MRGEGGEENTSARITDAATPRGRTPERPRRTLPLRCTLAFASRAPCPRSDSPPTGPSRRGTAASGPACPVEGRLSGCGRSPGGEGAPADQRAVVVGAGYVERPDRTVPRPNGWRHPDPQGTVSAGAGPGGAGARPLPLPSHPHRFSRVSRYVPMCTASTGIGLPATWRRRRRRSPAWRGSHK